MMSKHTLYMPLTHLNNMIQTSSQLELQETQAGAYAQLFPQVPHIYNSVEFNELNRHKAEQLHYLVMADTKVRFGIIAGLRGHILSSPFSAPFGGFNTNSVQRLEAMEAASSLLRGYASERGLQTHITLPPLVYASSQLSKWVNVLSRMGQAMTIDLSYYIPLNPYISYESIITSSARNKLHQALKHPFVLTKLNSKNPDDVARAYNIISKNRAEHQYPLRMSFEDVIKTIKIVNASFFVLSVDNIDVAAAQIYDVCDKTAQVIYWGDLKAYVHLRTMNVLAALLYDYYNERGYTLLDIGPATEDGVPNYGLCSFKEDIGCQASPKYSFIL